MKTKKLSLNDVVKGILNRAKNYPISQYTWEATKKLGKTITEHDVRKCFSHLKNEGKISISFNGQYPIGFSIC